MRKICLITAILFAMAVICQADVVIKKKTSLEGMMGMGNNESSETEYISVDKSCSERNSKFTGGMMAKATKGKKTENIQITRLDKGMVWNLEPDGKTYTEMSLDSLKIMMELLKGSLKDMPMGEDKTDDAKYEWTVDVKGPDDAGMINGFKCQSLSGKAIGINKENPKDKIRITYEYWLGQDVAGFKEMDQYYSNYAKAMGLDDYRTQQGMEAMAGKWTSHFGDLLQKVKEVGGFPVKTNMLVEKTEEAGAAESGEEGAMSDSAEGAKKAAEVMGKIGGLFGQKKPAKSADGMSTVFSMSQEVTSIEEKSGNEEKYELPSGYKKK